MIHSPQRAVAQLGRALEWGSRGREFESRRPDAGFLASLVFERIAAGNDAFPLAA